MEGLNLYIENIVKNKKIDYIDVIIDFAEKNEIDVEDLIKEIHPSIIEKIKVEYRNKNMVDGRTDKKNDKWEAEKNEPKLFDFF